MISELFTKARQRIERDRDTSWPAKIVKISIAATELARGLIYRRYFNEIGWGGRVCGRTPYIINRGYISVGNLFGTRSHTANVLIETSESGRIYIGDSVFVNFGSIISARQSVKIGNRVLIGPYSVICDTNSTDPTLEQSSSSIEIEDDVWLAARVTVLPGSRIGRGSVITSGSIVEGEIPPGVIAGGCPATVRKTIQLDKH
jgi:acetyltransferase-like isoleucine patch superfamily enzyme